MTRAGSLQDQIAFTKTLLTTHLETKGRIRRVRTPEGSKKYGLPIGSIITADKLRKVTRATARAAEQVMGSVDDPEPDAAKKTESNNDTVPYRVIRADKDLKGVDLKSGEFTIELLNDPTMNRFTKMVRHAGEDPIPVRDNMTVMGYRTGKPLFAGDEPRRFNMGRFSAGLNPLNLVDTLAQVTPADLRDEYTYEISEINWQDTKEHIDRNDRQHFWATNIEVRPVTNTPRGKGGEKLKYVATLQTGRRRGGGWRQFLAETPEEAFEAAARAVVLSRKRMTEVGDDYDEEGMWPVNRKARDYDGVVESWSGVRGWDYTVDEDDEIDFSDRNARYKLARKDANEMGFTWATADQWKKGDGSNQPIPVEVMESVNSLMRAHDDRYPGLANMFSKIGLVRTDATAYNGGENDAYGLIYHTTNVMGMSETAFGDTYKAKNGNAHHMTGRASLPTWNVSYGNDNLHERLGDDSLTPQQVVAIQVMTHEIGHSVGYILQGRSWDVLDGKHTSAVHSMQTDKAKDSVTNFHRTRMLEILQEYGMFDPKKAEATLKKKIKAGEYPYARYDLKDPKQRKEALDRLQQDHMHIGSDGFGKDDPYNRQAISEHLSEYAATNVSEIMAETWAAYHLQEEPGDFVREMGELMETALLDYLAETDMTKMPKPKEVVAARKAKGLPTWNSRHALEKLESGAKDAESPVMSSEVRKLTDAYDEALARGDVNLPMRASVLNARKIPGLVGWYTIDEIDSAKGKLVVRQAFTEDEKSIWVTGLSPQTWTYDMETERWEM